MNTLSERKDSGHIDSAPKDQMVLMRVIFSLIQIGEDGHVIRLFTIIVILAIFLL